MDPDEVARLVEELKISNEALSTKVEISTGGKFSLPSDLCRVLVGKVFVMRVVNREALRLQVSWILQLQRAVDIEIVGDNIFVVIFASNEDKRHALVDGPWNFFDSLMVFKAPTGLQKPSDIRFEEFSIWIQIHNLPILCMNQATVRKIGEQVGDVEEVDVGDGGRCLGQFARVRVRRRISKPLQRCVQIDKGEMGKALLSTSYMRSCLISAMHVGVWDMFSDTVRTRVQIMNSWLLVRG
ncbi:hypothetical protein C2S52_001425 [Perilla frutescens var. hirtella]|nr:hypothetical protein C2S52_001425 [Perilla frutescens var. hirtella]